MKKIKFNFDNIDKNTYIREREDKRLVHRNKAYKEIYLKNREKYSLPFGKYQVHHIDGNKFNNSIKNLLIVTREEHKKIHRINVDTLTQKEINEIIKKIKNLNGGEIKQMLNSFGKKVKKKKMKAREE